MSRHDSPFEKGTIYHSEFVKVTKADGPIEAKVVSEAHPSKFNKDKYVVGLVIAGKDHFYECETQECEKAFDGFKGQFVTIEAYGFKDEAEIIVKEAESGGGREERGREDHGRREERSSGREERGGRREERGGDRGGNRREERRQEPAENRADVEARALKKCRMMGARCSVLMQIALKAAEHTFSEHFGPDALKGDANNEPYVKCEDIRASANTIFIELKGMIDITKLPTKLPEPDAPRGEREEQKREERREERRPDPEPETESAPDHDDADSDDIPF